MNVPDGSLLWCRYMVIVAYFVGALHIMELSEVVNPHFAFPVVGVVLCAVLVFAFGFKSPVQPPSFDGIEEDRKPRKSKHKKKPHSNEHLENHTAEKLTASHKQPTNIRTTAAASKPAATADKSPHHQKDNKSKTKKSPVQNPLASDVEVIRESTLDNDGWETVSISKKKKRNKKEQDAEPAYITEKPPSRALGVHNEPATATEPASVMEPSLVSKQIKITEPTSVTEPALVDEQEKIASSDVKPQPQRTKREKSGKTKPKDADLSDKENTPEPDMQVKQLTEEKPTVQSVKSEKKGKKNKTTEEQKLLEIQSTQSPGGSAKEKKAKTKKAANKMEQTPQKEVSTSAANVAQKPAAETTVSSGSKAGKTQKSKKDKQKKEVNPPQVQEANSVQERIASSDSITKVKSDISSSQSTLSSAQESKKQVTATNSLSGTDTQPASDKTGDTAVGNVTFDELGDWQEAKPSKKRKSKVRRDN